MGICYFFLASIAISVLISWVMPMLDNFSSIYPNVLLLEGLKKQADPPLYSSLLKTFQNSEKKSKYSQFSERPLFDESTFAIFIPSKNETMSVLLIRNEINTENIADPVVTEIKMIDRGIDDFFNPVEGKWNERWATLIPGKAYMICSTKNHFDLVLVYQVHFPQGIKHKFRYFPDRTVLSYQDFELPGSSSLLTMSIFNDLIIYSVEEGFHSFHLLKKFEAPENSDLINQEKSTLNEQNKAIQDFSKDLQEEPPRVFWKEISKGPIQNRRDHGMSEVTGLKLFKNNGTLYLMQSKILTNLQNVSPRLSLEVLEFDSDSFKSMGILYNISVTEYLHSSYTTDDLKSNPKFRVSNQDSIIIGHFGVALFYVHIE